MDYGFLAAAGAAAAMLFVVDPFFIIIFVHILPPRDRKRQVKLWMCRFE